jgi:hypothetical protein
LDNFVMLFDKNAVVITLHNTVLMPGRRHPVSRLCWHLTILPPGLAPAMEPSPHVAAAWQHLLQTTLAFANAARLLTSLAELVTFAHAACFSPSLLTLYTALDLKHMTGFPGLISKLIRKHPPQSIATAMGHMDQLRKKQRSTKPKASPTNVAVSNPGKTRKIFSNQTGQFIIPLSTGSTQLFIL